MAEELSGLAPDVSDERRARIMAAVRAAPSPRLAQGGLRRLALAAAAAVLLLVTGTVGAVAASGDAVPSSPNYPLRSVGERFRLAIADTPTREQLRLSFAESRITQAHTALQNGDRPDAQGLLRDSRAYLDETKQDLGKLSANEQGQVQNQLNQAEGQQNQAEGQLNQQGGQGQNGS